MFNLKILIAFVYFKIKSLNLRSQLSKLQIRLFLKFFSSNREGVDLKLWFLQTNRLHVKLEKVNERSSSMIKNRTFLIPISMQPNAPLIFNTKTYVRSTSSSLKYPFGTVLSAAVGRAVDRCRPCCRPLKSYRKIMEGGGG